LLQKISITVLQAETGSVELPQADNAGAVTTAINARRIETPVATSELPNT
jgi:hypothetical protein